MGLKRNVFKDKKQMDFLNEKNSDWWVSMSNLKGLQKNQQ